MVADEPEIDRKGLVGLLATQPDFEIAGEAATGPEAIVRCRTLRPAVLILDTCLSAVDGVPAVIALRAAVPRIHILAVAAHGDGQCLMLNPPRLGAAPAHRPPCALGGTDCLLLAVMRGAIGAIRRTASPEDLFRAVRAVAAGNAWFEKATAARLTRRPPDSAPAHDPDTLSPRDLEVAALIAEGRCNKEIARALGIGEPAVKKHVGRLLHRLGLEDRLQIGLHVARHPEVLERIRALHH